MGRRGVKTIAENDRVLKRTIPTDERELRACSIKLLCQEVVTAMTEEDFKLALKRDAREKISKRHDLYR